MDGKLIKIATFDNSIEAELAKQLLDDYEITSLLSGENSANIYAGVPAIANIQLLVAASQAEEAIEILNSEQGQEE